MTAFSPWTFGPRGSFVWARPLRNTTGSRMNSTSALWSKRLSGTAVAAERSVFASLAGPGSPATGRDTRTGSGIAATSDRGDRCTVGVIPSDWRVIVAMIASRAAVAVIGTQWARRTGRRSGTAAT